MSTQGSAAGSSVTASSAAVRRALVEALELDLVGPGNDHVFARELLPEPPSRWYLTGFLVPSDAPVAQRTDPTADEGLDAGADGGGLDDAQAPDSAPARRSILPSSMGLSVLVGPEVREIKARVSWGNYEFEGAGEEVEPTEGVGVEAEPVDRGPQDVADGHGTYTAKGPGDGRRASRGYRRIPRSEVVLVPLPEKRGKPVELAVPDSGGLRVVVTMRPIGSTGAACGRMPADTRSVSVFVVNRRKANPERAYRGYAFQVELQLMAPKGFIARPDLRGALEGELAEDWDERVADLQYRDVFEYAVGHSVSATALVNGRGLCQEVRTVWVPQAEVESVAPARTDGVELGMEAIGALVDGAAAVMAFAPLVRQYRDWIGVQRGRLAGMDERRQQTAKDLLADAEVAAGRIEAGIALLADAEVLEAFRLANRAMAMAARRRVAILRGVDPAALEAPTWYPFQLAFILMALPGVADPTHADRETVDLLFFPTGGGKTEAYLGLAAFAMVLRRFRHPGVRSAGMSVLMRYTLRLLTLDQLSRASAVICALELERERDLQRLGTWPFEIGLWVGSAATPNRMGQRGYTGPGADATAYMRTRHYNEDSKRYPSPIPLENCPWCGTKFEGSGKSFRLVPSEIRPRDLRIVCVNHRCQFSGDRPLPIVSVDEPIYRRLPAFIIATVDKFAALPWTGETGALFGRVERYDQHGFYGPCDPGQGASLGGFLPPPDLIIQDELHLISGPLGTIAGVYETAIDALASRQEGERVLRPKVIASTATVRRADSQVRALFNRDRVAVFPPPGPDRRDSFFAVTQAATDSPARLYVGVAAQGRSLKVVLLRTALALLGAGETLYKQAGGKASTNNPMDPYMTLLGYFNSLRELGGSRRIIEDEVRTRLEKYSRRRRLDPPDSLFSDRVISYEVLELTSRVPTNQIAAAKRRLALPFQDKEHVDVALATNMISVGLDITRLGLMAVLGQPKTSAEYIQATSRVGRDQGRPGLVVTLMNVHKPRDRSHYERFGTYHATFYRAVEATSVTPFSPRALDRALAGALVALCRHGMPALTPAKGAGEITLHRGDLGAFVEAFARRAEGHRTWDVAVDGQQLRAAVLARCNSLLDDWLNITNRLRQRNTSLQYQQEVGGPQRLLYEPLHPDLPTLQPPGRNFRANRSMRDVEPNVEIAVKDLMDWREQP